MSDDFEQAALDYHEFPRPGKLAIKATKRMENQRDLALAYSPGVAAACLEIEKTPLDAARYTARSNLVAVITNGTAVLGLGAIGPLASKPVMEGKAVLFKKFADVDVFDLELDTTDVDRFCDAVELMEPTFGGINLEDIKAPQCFVIEKRLRENMNIPVFHDDQHGTAICVAAAIINGLRLSGKRIEDVKIVANGAGAASLACLNLLVSLGARKENITVADSIGVIYVGRNERMDEYKAVYAIETEARTLSDAMPGADVFLGLSAAGALSQDDVRVMAPNPMVMALANPDPEILPERVKEVRDDALIATGRSDYPNQVNNVLCFPFLFRGALDVGATEINETMKKACVEAIADLAMKESTDEVAAAYGGEGFRFGSDYLLPKPFDPRLMTEVSMRVAQAAMDSGVATRPIEDMQAYESKLTEFVHRSGMIMKPLFERAKGSRQRVVFAEGESSRILRSVQEMLDDDLCIPILVGRTNVITARIEELGLRFRVGDGEGQVRTIDQTRNPESARYSDRYHQLMRRNGVTPDFANQIVSTRGTALAALMLDLGEADAMVCGAQGHYTRHLRYVQNIIRLKPGVTDCSAITLLVHHRGHYLLADTHITYKPSAEHIAETAKMAADIAKRFGIKPKIALLSHSNFGSRANEDSRRIKEARNILAKKHPTLNVEGEMHADTALDGELRDKLFPGSAFSGSANVLMMPNLDAANIAYNLIKVLGGAQPVGPMLAGLQKPVHILTESANVRSIINVTAIAVVDALDNAGK